MSEESLKYQNVNPFNSNPENKGGFINLNNLNKMSDNNTQTSQTTSQPQVSQTQTKSNQNQPKPKKLLINDYLKTKKGLYARIKRAYLKRIGEDIDKGRKSNVDINKFIFDLVEMGLGEYEG